MQSGGQLHAFGDGASAGGGVARAQEAVLRCPCAVEVKTRALYEKSPEKAHTQVCGYVDRLGQKEGWLVVVDSDLTKPWDGKISSEEVSLGGKAIHVVRC